MFVRARRVEGREQGQIQEFRRGAQEGGGRGRGMCPPPVRIAEAFSNIAIRTDTLIMKN